jgi:precorrin-6B methylase 2
MASPLIHSNISSYLAEVSPAEQELMRLFRADEALAVFDIGSCEGEDSIRYARRFPSARVFAFEPLPGNQQLIRANFARFDQHGAGATRAVRPVG